VKARRLRRIDSDNTQPATPAEPETSSPPAWKVVNYLDGRSRIEVDGTDVTSQITDYVIRFDRHDDGPRLSMGVVAPVEITMLGDASPRWHGLSEVPDAALVAEVARRGLG